MTKTQTSAAIDRLAAQPRAKLAHLPTRLVPLRRLGAHLGTERLWAKMDAETGFALGGNKVRKLEFELAPPMIDGVTCLITAGGPQSNHCRVTAAFAAHHGLRCVLVTNRGPDGDPRGNALLHRLFGAEIVTVADRDRRAPHMETVAAELRASGETPLVVPIGASTPLGCLGYANAALEVCRQLDALDDGCTETIVFSASSSGGTLAGLILGLALLERSDVRLVGVSADAPALELDDICRSLARRAATEVLRAEVDVAGVPFRSVDDEVGDGYGIPTDASREATDLFGRLAGLVLDPTYTSKAGAALIGHLRRDGLADHQRVVFLHTGGAPGLLA